MDKKQMQTVDEILAKLKTKKENRAKEAEKHIWKGETLSPDQENAVQTVLSAPSGHTFFLSGQAGTGKSTVIKYIKITQRKIAVTAMTGAAAYLIKGQTIHSYAGILPNNNSYVLADSEKAEAKVKWADLIIIDEASMMSDELFDYLQHRFSGVKKYPKVLLVGDFLQLPPVKAVPFYKSKYWSDVKLLKLTTIHRQKDLEFISVLNDVRKGELSEKVKQFLSVKKVEILPDDCVHLMSLKESVERRNNQKLDELSGNLYEFEWKIENKHRNLTDEKLAKVLKNLRYVSKLKIKVGARVILTNNNEGIWFNGSTGTVIGFEMNGIAVQLDTGRTVYVDRISEVIMEDAMKLFTITQYPIILGYAATIHRGQGSTYGRIGVNLDNHFAEGQTYVALSRCTCPEGVFVSGSLSNIKTDLEAVKLFG